MIKIFFLRYVSNFRGFSYEIWILAAITFVNKFGAMTIPFFSKYLKENQNYSFHEVGWIMLCSGFGSVFGSWLGGKLSDRIGASNVAGLSLFVSALIFFSISKASTFGALCIVTFLLLSAVDMLRPAMFILLSNYSHLDRRIRSFSLVRLANNFGFAIGPAIGGLVIVKANYTTLFVIDGGTSFLALIIFIIFLPKWKKNLLPIEGIKKVKKNRILEDKVFCIFLLVCFVSSVMYVQIFSTIPLFHKEVFGLTEFETGLLMSLNGFLIFFVEMPIVAYMEKKKTPLLKVIFWGVLSIAVGYLSLLINLGFASLVISMLFITLGEILSFPFSDSFALRCAPKNQKGNYMAFFAMSFSAAYVISAFAGMQIISIYGYSANWIFMGSLGFLAAILILYLRRFDAFLMRTTS